MSIWTHVAGVIRIDDIRIADNDMPDFDELIGKECLYNDSKEVWEDLENNPDAYLPCGSEGTLQKSVWVNPDKCEVAAYTVTVFGDLRDYEQPEAIKKWFIKKCVEVNDKFSVRNAMIMAESEDGSVISWVCKPNYTVAEKHTSACIDY